MESPIAQAKMVLGDAHSRFLKTFAAVPDDKLTWSPSPTAKSALALAAHTGISEKGIAGALRGESAGAGMTMEQMQAHSVAAVAAVKTREDALALIEAGVADAHAALDALTPEALAGNTQTPFGTIPTGYMIYVLGTHMANHAAQIDYLQTCWGDMEMHM